MSSATFTTINPATEEQIETFTFQTSQEVEATLSRAEKGFVSYRQLPIQQRAELILKLATTLRRDKDRLAKVVTTEMGKTIAEAEAEVEKCAHEAEWYAEHGPRMLADEPAPTGDIESYISFLPLGTILGIMPWNFPLWQAMRFGIPALLAGNTILLKHSPNTQRSSLHLERVVLESGFAEGVLQNVIVPTEEIVKIINDRRVQGVSVTGSVRAGAAVASEAGKVIKKSVLELGGSDAFIVLEDADIHKAVKAGVKGRFSNTGQVCLAAKRFILIDKIADEFEEQFVKAAQALKVGDPTDRTMQLGPIARGDLRDGLDKQVKSSVAAGARVLCGGEPIPGKGFFYAPTVLSGVGPGMTAFDEETFGPVAAIIRVPDAESAISAANASQYGLSGNVWTKDVDRARKIARQLDTGGVFINGITASDPRVPVGGVKNSGYGRELSHFGPHTFVNAQTVWIEND
jgi:acyl-CoA reductase-like NAD-dependent aldehyde dehydrogenase